MPPVLTSLVSVVWHYVLEHGPLAEDLSTVCIDHYVLPQVLGISGGSRGVSTVSIETPFLESCIHHWVYMLGH
jgi:hypothetical protein